VQAYRFALDPTPAQQRALASHAGAARFAYNLLLARVKADLDARKQNPEHQSVGWTQPALRREWNAQTEGGARAVVDAEQQRGGILWPG
jgi:putative transposase